MTEVYGNRHEVRRRTALGKEAFNKKRDPLKKRVVKAFVWSVTLYGSET